MTSSLNRIVAIALVCTLVIGGMVCFAKEDGESSDRSTLVALYHATDGETWTKNDGWLSDSPLDDWHGVAARSGRVTGLYLSGNSLTGALPADLAQLTSLEVLNLRWNSLEGPLPDLSKLDLLKNLFLNNNQFSGEIPKWIGNLQDLERLDLSNNQLVGSIPGELGSLSALWDLRLSNNSLSGKLPAALAKLENLEYLDLRWNEIEEPLPDLSELKTIKYFFLAANQLNGKIPKWLANLRTLKRLDLSHNHLVGSFPTELRSLQQLNSLKLQNNKLNGTLPPEIGNLQDLERLDLSNNKLEGLIPAQLGSLSLLRHINLSNNNLSGSLPPALSRLESLAYLDLRWNSFTGPLPDLSEIEPIKTLLLTDNEFGGEIPKWIGNLRNLERFDISYNQFRGIIPWELENLSKLHSLAAHHNKLEGAIPPEIGKMHELRRLILNDNQLSGLIPDQLGSLSSLRHLNLSNNSFSGNVPEWISTSEILEWVDLRGNSLDLGAEMFRVAMPDYYKFWTFPDKSQLDDNDDREFGGIDSMQSLVRDMWAQSSEVIESSQIRAFVFQSFSVIEIREGYVHVSGQQLPEFIRKSNIRGVVSTLNKYLIEWRVRVSSPSDLERSLKAVESATPGLKTVDLFDTGKPLKRIRWETESLSVSGFLETGIHALKDEIIPIVSSIEYEGLWD